MLPEELAKMQEKLKSIFQEIFVIQEVKFA